MNLNKQKQPAIMQVYNAYWDNYLKGDVEAMHPLLADDYTQVGSAEGEVFLNKKDAVQFLYDTIDQVAGKLEMRNRSIKLEQQNKIILIHECCDLYALAGGDWIFYSKFRASTLMHEKKEGWKITHQHSSFPDSKTDDGQNIAIEKIATENLQLKEAVKRRTVELENKTRDLEIEASLERVRAVALGMKKPADLTGICEVLFTELTTLGFAEIRNAMINIHDDEKATFINYDYSDEIGQSINHLRYDIHPVIEKQIRQIRSAGDAFSETYFKGKDLEDWKAFRKNIGEKDDPRIEKTKALYYYFYSIGTGSIGISTFNSIGEEKLNLLKRFRNVFDFAYRRYMDVAQAEAQAKEAQIELALERVRARAMAMQNSDELIYVADVMREQMGLLGQQALDTCAVHLYPNDSTSFDSWYAFRLKSTGKIVSGKTSFPKDGCELIREMIDGYHSKLGDYILEAKGAKLKEWLEVLANAAPELTNNIGEIPETGYYHLSDFSGGSLVMASFQPPSAESIVLQKKCANTFDLAYRRYLDLKKAEAQSREARIELALERVRARTMAMQHSGELMDAANLLFQQVQSLGIPIWSCGYNIWEKGEKFCTGWMSTNGAIQPSFRIPLTESYTFMHMNESRQKGEPFYVDEVSGEALAEHYRYMFSLPDFKAIADEQIKDGFPLPTFQINHVFNFRHGNLIFLSGQPIREAWDIFKRFTAVFEQTYTRFLDLQKAETQAREAQIETALERVRSRTMGMQKSEELPEAANLLFQQMQALGMPAWSAGYCIWDEDKQGITLWMSSEGVMQPSFHAPLTEDPSFINFLEAYKKGETFFVNEIGGEALIEHYQYMRTLPVVGEILDSIINEGHSLPGFQIFHCAYFSLGFLLFITYEPVPEAHDIFKRFAKVFEQTYTRFLDLQQAEAQARESQIQLALERVRARTMAMQKSEELKQVAALLFKQVSDLGIKIWTTGFKVWSDDNNFCTDYVTNPQGGFMEPYIIDSSQYLAFVNVSNAKKRGDDFFMRFEEGEQLEETYKQLSKCGETQFKAILDSGFQFPSKQYEHHVFGSKSSLLFITYEPVPEAHDIFKRFGKVFEQTYTRFLDLQKAEAQAKEAQIEAALEKVRSRSLAMHTANELGEVVTIIVEKLRDLGVVLDANGVILCTYFQHSKDVMHWIVSPDYSMAGSYLLPYFDHPIFNDAWQSRESGDEYFSKSFSVEEKNSFFEYAFEHSDYKYFPEDFKQWVFQNDKHILSFAWQKNSAILIPSHTGVLPTESDKAILIRFAKVFEQSYVRFLDLQKSEEQARESRIQLALERVRARTMAMQKSDELMETAVVLFDQLKQLGENIERTMIGVVNEEEHVVDVWATRQDGRQMDKTQKFPIDEPILLQKVYSAWQQQKKSIVIDLQGEELESYFHFLKSRAPRIERETFGERRVENFAFFSKGFLGVISSDPNTAANIELYERFAAVFDQTYTRFLDLQKAEAQAREAQIEAALERVRSRSMGMQKSEELKEVIQVVYEQFVHLNIHIEHTGFLMDYKERDDMHIWLADKQEIPSEVIIPYFDSPPNNSIKEAKEKGEDFFTYLLTFEEKNKFYEELFKFIPGVPDESLEYYFNYPGLAGSGVLLENIGLYIENFSGTPYSDEENKILMRFGKVFQQTYTRFLDLQKAEARAREAKIEAALERARTQSMLMQHSKELDDTLRVFHEQVLLLGINSAFSFLWLPDEDKDRHIFWAAWQENNSFKSKAIDYALDRNEPATAQCIIDWKSNEPVYSYAVPPAEVNNYFAVWKELIDGVEKLTPEHFSDGLHYVEAFMKYGCFGVMVATDLREDEKKILGRFAIEFERAYTRFLDLQKAEAQAREAKIEASLEKVRSRSLAMHKSEELQNVVSVVFEKLIEFISIQMDGVSILIPVKESKDIIEWVASEGKTYPEFFRTPYIDNPILTTVVTARDSGVEYLARVFDYEEKNMLWNYAFEHSGYKNLPEEMKKRILESRNYAYSVAFQKNSAIVVASIAGQVLPEDESEILKRFAKVFEQAYTRFLDLQKAEAQAREAQIETGLERVRSRSLAMHNTSELQEVIHTVHKELLNLNIAIHGGSFIAINSDVDKVLRCWGSGGTADTSEEVLLPLYEKSFCTNLINRIKNGPGFFTEEYTQKEKKDFFTFLFKYEPWSKLDDKQKKETLSSPGGYTRSCCVSRHTSVFIVNHFGEKFSAADNDILQRFGKVFEQTYTRFLDLQKAEAQAREAKIEAALEKVRSRAMAMQKPGELVEVAELLRKEMGLLGVEELETSSIYIHHQDTQNTECWYAIKDIKHPDKELLSDYMNINLHDTSVGRQMLAFYQSGEMKISIPMEGIIRKEWINYCASRSKVLVGYYGDNIPDRTYHLYKFSNGYMGAASPADISAESWDLLKRATSVFSLAYTRFSDLQRAEAHAVQAEEDLIKLQTEKKRAEDALNELQVTQKQLIQSEKMASLGELTAGIAHEIQNPLNFVNNFSEVSNELIDEMMEEVAKGNFAEVKAIADDVKQNLEKINHHGKRADGIVKGMLQHSRSTSTTMELTDINKLADEYLHLAYHGLRAKDKLFNAALKTDYDTTLEKINVIPQDIGRVILNLINNAFYAVSQRHTSTGSVLKESEVYEPTVSISTKKTNDHIEISVNDNGKGISQKIIDKIFQPFFTTKPTGQGTGLGLSLAYDIIKAHGGEIKVDTKETEGTTFIIHLPITNA